MMAESNAKPAAPGKMVREAVGAFHNRDSFQAAVDDLMNAGFDRAELSLLASQKAVEQKLGKMYEKVADLEDSADAPRTAYVGKDSLVEAKTGVIGGLAYVGALTAVGAVVASGGSLGVVIGAAIAAGGGGGAIGAWFARYLGRERARSMEEQLGKGGLLLWVRVKDAAHESSAVEILSRHAAADVHVHELSVPAEPEPDPMSGVEPDPFLPKARV